MPHKFLVHEPHDSVGVAVADIRAGETVDGVILSDNSVTKVAAAQDVPLGHKIALVPLAAGATVTKYNVPIGKTTAAIRVGDHVHVHNLKSARW
ncbi:MAG TPA: UxaA family hydrolase [Vicinamibacterales bacterium]|nr:UxaA family hydrolase [Vicinamibacterales bacterium]